VRLGSESTSEIMTLLEDLDLRFPEVKFLLAFLYSRGLGVRRDRERAFTLLGEASDAGVATAQFFMGSLMESGQIPTESVFAIVQLYEKAANQGHSLAAASLGDLYERGDVVPQDMACSIKWYTLSANLGNGTAATHLGSIYENGMLVPKDESAALRWYHRAAELNDIAGNGHLSRIFHDGALGVSKDLAKGREFLKRKDELRQAEYAGQLQCLLESATHGDKVSQEILSEAYRIGALGTAANLEKAEYWSKKAREQEEMEKQVG